MQNYTNCRVYWRVLKYSFLMESKQSSYSSSVVIQNGTILSHKHSPCFLILNKINDRSTCIIFHWQNLISIICSFVGSQICLLRSCPEGCKRWLFSYGGEDRISPRVPSKVLSQLDQLYLCSDRKYSVFMRVHHVSSLTNEITLDIK